MLPSRLCAGVDKISYHIGVVEAHSFHIYLCQFLTRQGLGVMLAVMNVQEHVLDIFYLLRYISLLSPIPPMSKPPSTVIKEKFDKLKSYPPSESVCAEMPKRFYYQ